MTCHGYTVRPRHAHMPCLGGRNLHSSWVPLVGITHFTMRRSATKVELDASSDAAARSPASTNPLCTNHKYAASLRRSCGCCRHRGCVLWPRHGPEYRVALRRVDAWPQRPGEHLPKARNAGLNSDPAKHWLSLGGQVHFKRCPTAFSRGAAALEGGRGGRT
jgi:hypothetical protein